MEIRLSAFADEIDNDLEVQINVLKKNGIRLIELRSIDKIGVLDFTESQAEAYAKTIRENDMAVWSIGSPLGKVDINVDFNEYEKKIRHLFDIAKIFQCEKVRIFSFYNAYNDKEKVFEYLNKMVRIAKEYNIKLYHENEKNIFGDVLSRVLDIKNSVKDIRLIYDPANFIQSKEKPDDTINSLMEITDYFHIKDVIAESNEIVPAGYGDAKIFEIVSKINKDTTLTLEPHLKSFDAFKKIDDTELKTSFSFSDNKESFNFACQSLKKILKKANYVTKKNDFEEIFVK